MGLQSDIVTTNFNSTNENNIEDEAEENIDGEIDFLEQVGYYDEEEDEQWDESRESRILNELIDLEEERIHTSQDTQDTTQMSQPTTQLSQDATQMSQDPTQMSQRDRSHARNVVQKNKKLSFVTDNARDIRKAVSTTYQWLGCAAHHVNLIVKEAFKKI